jgi:hypothetical protein
MPPLLQIASVIKPGLARSVSAPPFAEITWLIAWMTLEFGVVTGVLASRRFSQIG